MSYAELKKYINHYVLNVKISTTISGYRLNIILNDMLTLINSLNGIYSGSGSLSGATAVTQAGNELNFEAVTVTNDTVVSIRDTRVIIQSENVASSQRATITVAPTIGRFQWRDPAAGDLSTFEVSAKNIFMRNEILGDKQEIDFSETDMIVTDTINSKGLYNAADYSSGATDRWLVDKGYVDSFIIKSKKVSVDVSAVKNDLIIMSTGDTDKTVTFPASPVKDDIIKVTKEEDGGVGKVIVDGNGKLINRLGTDEIVNAFTFISYHFDGVIWRKF